MCVQTKVARSTVMWRLIFTPCTLTASVRHCHTPTIHTPTHPSLTPAWFLALQLHAPTPQTHGPQTHTHNPPHPRPPHPQTHGPQTHTPQTHGPQTHSPHPQPSTHPPHRPTNPSPTHPQPSTPQPPTLTAPQPPAPHTHNPGAPGTDSVRGLPRRPRYRQWARPTQAPQVQTVGDAYLPPGTDSVRCLPASLHPLGSGIS